MQRRQCYNSGKIGGLPLPVAARKFHLADKEIMELGYIPVNPMKNCLKWSDPWILHMIVDVCNMLGCNAVFFQKDWMDSKGARIEYKIAKFFGKELIFQK